jgi:hypothetical protein
MALIGMGVFLSLMLLVMWSVSKPPVLAQRGLMSTEQNKTGVVKEAYLVQPDGSFLHQYLCAKGSVFKMMKEGEKIHFIEHLEGISAVVEDMSTKEGQLVKQIRSFQAGQGVWDYDLRHLRASGVTLSVVEAQKSGLRPVFQGHADAFNLFISEGKPVFTIEGFKAKLSNKK